LINGTPAGFFHSPIGIWQGDHLSTLFLSPFIVLGGYGGVKQVFEEK
jgi:hypothetical protein